MHLAVLPLSIAASVVLICVAPAGWVKAACAVYGAAAMLLFANSALLHVVPWTSVRVTKILCAIDYSNIFLIIAATLWLRWLPYLPALQKELVEVIRKYVSIDQDQVQVALENQGSCSILELNITLPDR